MTRGKLVTIHVGEVTQSLFEKHPVWCEYYEPDEIIELIEMGEEEDFLNRELIEKVELSDGRLHPLYSVPINAAFIREFLFVGGKFKIMHTEFDGYIFKIKNEINTISVFFKERTVDLYFNEDFADENAENIRLITGSSVDVGSFDIPCRLYKMDGTFSEVLILSVPVLAPV